MSRLSPMSRLSRYNETRASRQGEDWHLEMSEMFRNWNRVKKLKSAHPGGKVPDIPKMAHWHFISSKSPFPSRPGGAVFLFTDKAGGERMAFCPCPKCVYDDFKRCGIHFCVLPQCWYRPVPAGQGTARPSWKSNCSKEETASEKIVCPVLGES